MNLDNIDFMGDLVPTFKLGELETHKRLFSYAIGGDSLFRAYQNEFLRGLRFQGETLDLGSKSQEAKHLKHLDFRIRRNIVLSDVNSSLLDRIIMLDVERRFPFPDRSFSNVMAINLLEHVFDWSNVFDETVRVL